MVRQGRGVCARRIPFTRCSRQGWRPGQEPQQRAIKKRVRLGPSDGRGIRRWHRVVWLLAMGMLLYAACTWYAALLPGGKDADAIARGSATSPAPVMYMTFAPHSIALARHAPTNANGRQQGHRFSASFMRHSSGAS